MARYFIDTSVLVKRYRSEQGTEAVDALFAEIGSAFVISRLGIVETVSALGLNVRIGELSNEDYVAARKRFVGEIGEGRISVVRLLVGHYRDAERLVDSHAKSRRCRTLDALQLSVAMNLHRQDRIDTFLCADSALCELANLEQVPTINPLVPS